MLYSRSTKGGGGMYSGRLKYNVFKKKPQESWNYYLVEEEDHEDMEEDDTDDDDEKPAHI
jgi:hypothetical protein